MSVVTTRLRAAVAADRLALDRQFQLIAERTGERGDAVAATALALHFCYGAVEAILERVCLAVEGELPSGRDWHRRLLEAAGLELAGTRPALLTAETLRLLAQLRGFRHFLRHAYGAEIDPDHVARLAAVALQLQPVLATDLDALDAWLGSVADPD